MDGKEYLSQLPVADTNQVVVEIHHKGREHKFILPRLISIRDYTQWADKLKKREEALKMHGGKLPCTVDAELIERARCLFPDAECDGGKATFFLLSPDEIQFATIIEACIEPKFSWGEAAYLVRIDGALAGAIAAKFGEINSIEEGVAAAKKD